MRQEQEAKFKNSPGSCPKFCYSEKYVGGGGAVTFVKLQPVTLCVKCPGFPS